MDTSAPAGRAPLETGKILAKASGGNGQIRYGADVINRIIESVTAEGDARRLQLGAQILKDGDLLRGGEVRHLHAAPVGAGDIGDLDLRVAHHGGQAGQTPPGGAEILTNP